MPPKHILTIVGARPQFVKASALSKAIALHPGFRETVVHTGQHFDKEMSKVFFDELEMAEPAYSLGINGLSHGAMTGRMLEEIEQIIYQEKPDFVVLYGDTNSTLAGALAASKLGVKVVHIEAGLRSNNWQMPEEQNRVLVDRMSDFLFVPSQEAIDNLKAEGISTPEKCIEEVGDIMYDVFLTFSPKAEKLTSHNTLMQGDFVLASVHRQENVEDKERFEAIVNGLNALHKKIPVLLPLHPRTRAALKKHNLRLECELVEPFSYLEMLSALSRCAYVLTDSGGLQKEAYYAGKMCFTLRNETEWVELVELGANVLVSPIEKLEALVESTDRSRANFSAQPYGSGKSTSKILETLLKEV